jgi:outer membrane receptor protein involved in Fe transport
VTGGLDGDPATTFGLPQFFSNTGTLSTRGFDIIANYNNDLGFAKWASSLVVAYTISQKFQATPASVNRECVGLYSNDCGFTGSIQPKWQWSWRNTFTFGKFDASVLWRHISGVSHETGGLFVGNLPAAVPTYGGQAVDFNRIPSYDWIDLTLRFNMTDNVTLTASVQNLFDKAPPIVGSTAGTTSFNSGNTYPSTYDALGRRFAVSARLKF